LKEVFNSSEVFRSEVSKELISTQQQRFALASDIPVQIGIPCFDLGDFSGISDLIEQSFLRKQ